MLSLKLDLHIFTISGVKVASTNETRGNLLERKLVIFLLMNPAHTLHNVHQLHYI